MTPSGAERRRLRRADGRPTRMRECAPRSRSDEIGARSRRSGHRRVRQPRQLARPRPRLRLLRPRRQPRRQPRRLPRRRSRRPVRLTTKRVVRAMLRATDICTAKPDWVARRLVDRGVTPRYDYARQTFDDVSYRAWRDFGSEDSVRFYALRLRELGLIRSAWPARKARCVIPRTEWRGFARLSAIGLLFGLPVEASDFQATELRRCWRRP